MWPAFHLKRQQQGSAVVQNVDSREGCVCQELGGRVQELSVLSAQFWCEPKTSLKI